MKPTLNINLAGYPFTIDEDAYRLLKDYLDTIRYAFDTKEDTEDLATDIESRIAEILVENEAGGLRIVTIEEISKVIESIGKPSEFIEVDESSPSVTPPPYNPSKYSKNPFIRKRIFRDPHDAMLGGVCAGLAAYMHVDVTIVRIITVLLFFLSATIVAIAYVILWIVVPEANTPFQHMQMMGEDPTVENIGRTVTENYQTEPNENQSAKFTGLRKFVTGAFSILVKCVIILGFIIGFPVLLALLLVLLACIIAFFAAGGALIGVGIFGDELPFKAPGGGVLALYLLLATIGAIITLGIPFWLLIKMVFKKNAQNLSPNNRRSLVIIWLIGIALTAVFTVKSVKKAKYLDQHSWGINFEKLEELNELKEEDIEKINYFKGGVVVTTTNGKKYKLSKGQVEMLSSKETKESEEIEEIEEINTDSIQIVTDTIN